MEIQIQPQTVVIAVGPTNCGKSYLFEHVQVPAGYRYVHISSDAERRALLGYDAHKYSIEMKSISGQAFEMLFKKLEMALQFPVLADCVVLDTMGFSLEFRLQVQDIAKKYGYKVDALLFDYKDPKSFERNAKPEELGIIRKSISKFHRIVLPEMRRKHYANFHRIRKPDVSLTLLPNTATDYSDVPHFVIGDVHGCFDQMQQLIKNAKLDSDTQIVLAGDFIDKGPDSEKVLDWILANKNVHPVIGNHENFIHKHFTGQLTDVGPEAYANFPDIAKMEAAKLVLREGPTWIDKLKQVMETRCTPYYNGGYFHVTHAPCPELAICRLDKKFATAQRNFRYTDTVLDKSLEDANKALRESLQPIVADATYSKPWHVFGHIPAVQPSIYKNKYCIDGGCVDGGELIGLYFKRPSLANWTSKPEMFSVKGPKAKTPAVLYTPFVFVNELRGIKTLANVELTDDSRKRIHWLAKNKINFISGTMSPSDKNTATGTLESVEKAMEYYAAKGITTIVAEPKFMGSRANIYLKSKPEDCYTATRNGFLVRPDLDLKSEYSRLIAKLGITGDDMLILDAELCPWHALGAGLINNIFRSVGYGITTETKLLEETGFRTQVEAAKQKNAEVIKASCIQEKDQVIKEYGHAGYSAAVALRRLRLMDPDKQKAYLETYMKQLELYGQDGVPAFHPFAILKEIKNGKETVCLGPGFSNYEMFKQLNPAPVIRTSIKDVSSVQAFFDEMTVKNNFEGIVIKPESTYIKDVAPYIKVRNPRYLSIVYGFDYLEPEIYNELLAEKSTVVKMRLAISEYELGKKMLEVPYNEIAETHEIYAKAANAILGEIAKETGLDARL